MILCGELRVKKIWKVFCDMYWLLIKLLINISRKYWKTFGKTISLLIILLNFIEFTINSSTQCGALVQIIYFLDFLLFTKTGTIKAIFNIKYKK